MVPGYKMERLELAQTIDHTSLQPSAVEADIIRLCSEAIEWKFCAVCVNSAWVACAKRLLDGSGVKVVSTVAFPLGSIPTAVKCFETAHSVKDGADEIDFVQNIALLKERAFTKILAEFRDLVKAAENRPLKVIIETSLLSEEEKIAASELACEAGLAFIKTSTGFYGGATAADVALLHRIAGNKAGIKASGGIRDAVSAMNMLQAGASRLGTSASIAIMREFCI